MALAIWSKGPPALRSQSPWCSLLAVIPCAGASIAVEELEHGPSITMFSSPCRLLLAVIPCAGAGVADEELAGLCQRAACGLSLEPQLAAMGALLADACPGLPHAQVRRLQGKGEIM